jgi:hypothetical protein
MRLHQFAAAACMALLAGASQAAFLVTYEAPGATHTTSAFDYVGVETFNGRGTGVQTFSTDFGTTGQSTVITGNYSKVQLNTVDVYGGASNSNYAVAFGNTPYDVTLSASNSTGAVPVTYFGYWLSALDRGNQVKFYRAGTEVFSFDPTQVLTRAAGCAYPRPARAVRAARAADARRPA